MCKYSATKFIYFVTVVLTSLTVHAAPLITLLSPKAGSTSGSPIYFEADATSPGCAKGISAIRVYTGDGVSAVTVSGGHLETFIRLSSGTYNTVVQAWDNCGALSKAPIRIVVASTAGVSLFLPAGSSNSTPLHIAASAQNLACGIDALRIYTAPGVAPYTINSDQMDAFVTLPPGKYGLVAQAWDKCGHVYKTPASETVTITPDKYLYTANNRLNTLSKFEIANGVLKNPNGAQAPPQYPVPELPMLLGADPSGHFVYVANDAHIFSFQVDRSTGNLFSVSGALAVTGKGLNGLAVDPAGHFLYASFFGSSNLASYRIDRSTGVLTFVGSVPAPTQGSTSANTIVGPSAITTDATGQFVYASIISNTLSPPVEVQGYRVDSNSGKLQALGGGPKVISGSQDSRSIAIAGKFLYVNYTNSQGAWVQGYSIAGDGSLASVPGSPFPNEITLGDWLMRFALSVGSNGAVPPQAFLTNYKLSSGGSLGTASNTPTGNDFYLQLVEDHSAQFVYGGGEDCSGCTAGTSFPPGVVASWRVDSAGKPVMISGPLATGDTESPPNAIVVTR